MIARVSDDRDSMGCKFILDAQLFPMQQCAP